MATGAEIHEIRPDERRTAGAVLAQAFWDNPIERAAFHRREGIRERQLRKIFSGLVAVPSIQLQGAYLGGDLVGVAAVTPFGRCSLKTSELRHVVGPMLRVGPLSVTRFSYWMARWHAADPKRPHRHLQLLGVKPALQGKGIGTLLLRWYCTGLDDHGEFAYHETDKPENLAFYGRQDFDVVGETRVLGVQTWRLAREPQSRLKASLTT